MTNANKNRTRSQAWGTGALPVGAKTLALPILPRYRSALGLARSNHAHLQMIRKDVADHVDYEGGEPSLNGQPVDNGFLANSRDDRPGAVAGIDMPTIYLAYSLVYDSLRDDPTRPEKIDEAIRDPAFCGRSLRYYVPELLRAAGITSNANDSSLWALLGRIGACRNAVGVIPTVAGAEYLPALFLRGYDAEKNMIELASPFFHKIVLLSRRDSILRDEDGEPRLRYDGEPLMAPSHSELVKFTILKERNRRAVEAVCVIVAAIEAADGDIPRITARYVVDRCPNLGNALKAANPVNRNGILERTFRKAWELLLTQTRLTEAYKDIRIPHEVPTFSRLDEVIEFPHKGRIAGTGQDYD